VTGARFATILLKSGIKSANCRPKLARDMALGRATFRSDLSSIFKDLDLAGGA
jgi:hypothetical protein